MPSRKPSAADLRPMTDREWANLHEGYSPSFRIFMTPLVLSVGAGMSLAFAHSFILEAVSGIARFAGGTSPIWFRWLFSTCSPWLALWLVVTAAVFLDSWIHYFRSHVWLDLKDRMARVERYRATETLRGINPEHRDRSYFLRLEDGRVIYLGYWNPPKSEDSAGLEHPPESKEFPSTEFTLVRAARSGVILDVQGSGRYLEPTQTFELSEPSIKEGFLKTPWEKIPQRYGSDGKNKAARNRRA